MPVIAFQNGEFGIVGKVVQVGKFDRKGWIRKLCFQRLFNKLSTLFKCKPFTFAVTACFFNSHFL